MKRIISKLGVALVVVAAMTFLISGTASAQTITNAHQTIPASVHAALACPATLVEGNSGSTVKTLQIALNGLFDNRFSPFFFEDSPDVYHNPLTVDGSFGSQTLDAVIDFQTWNSPAVRGSLVVDGEVGPNTWHDLGKC